MTHFSDGLAVGGAITNPKVGSQGGFGIQTTQSVVLDIVPLTKNASAYAASQSPGSAALTLSAGTGVTAVVDGQGVTRYTADVARAVTITSGGNDTGITFTIKGYDQYGVAMTQVLTGASGGTATTTKAFLSVISITPSGAVASTVTAGTADKFGLPIAVIDSGYLSSLNWGSGSLPAYDSGTLVLADTTNPATGTTGDVRGTYAPSSASNGTKRLVVEILISALQSVAAPSATTAAAILGQTQF